MPSPRAPRAVAAPREAAARRRLPRQERSRATVDAILEAAERLVRTRGVEATTTPAVAELAGVSVGSLYQYFPSKHALVAALIERHASAGAAMQEETLARVAGGSLEDAVRGFVDTLVTAFRERGPIYAPLLAAMHSVDRARFARRELDRCVVLATLALGPHATRLAPRDPGECAYVLTVALNAVVRDAVERRPELLASPTLVADLEALCLGYLRPR